MAIPYNDAQVDITASSNQKEFLFDFPLFDKSELVVQETSINNTITTLTLDVDYTIPASSLNNQTGGSIVLTTGATANHIFTIKLNVEYSRKTDFNNAQTFNAKNLNNEFDKVTQQIQQLARDVDRSFKVPNGSTINTELPTPEAGKAIGWNDEATAIQNSSTDISLIDDAITPVQAAKTAAETAQSEAESARDEAQTISDNLDSLISQNLNVINIKRSTGFGGNVVQGDGTTNDAVAIQAAFDSLVEGDHLYFPKGDYLINAEIHLSNAPDNIIITGDYGATIISTQALTSDSKAILKIENCSNWSFDRLKFDARHHSTKNGNAYKYGVWGFNAKNIFLRNCEFTDCHRGYLAQGTTAQHITFRDCHIDGGHNYNDAEWSNNQLSNALYGNFDSANSPQKQVSLIGCTGTRVDHLAICRLGGNFNIIDCYTYDTFDSSFYSDGCDNTLIANCISERAGKDGMKVIGNSKNAMITNCLIIGGSGHFRGDGGVNLNIIAENVSVDNTRVELIDPETLPKITQGQVAIAVTGKNITLSNNQIVGDPNILEYEQSNNIGVLLRPYVVSTEYAIDNINLNNNNISYVNTGVRASNTFYADGALIINNNTINQCNLALDISNSGSYIDYNIDLKCVFNTTIGTRKTAFYFDALHNPQIENNTLTTFSKWRAGKDYDDNSIIGDNDNEVLLKATIDTWQPSTAYALNQYVKYIDIDSWIASTVYSVGDIFKYFAHGKYHYCEVTTAGTSGATNPGVNYTGINVNQIATSRTNGTLTFKYVVLPSNTIVKYLQVTTAGTSGTDLSSVTSLNTGDSLTDNTAVYNVIDKPTLTTGTTKPNFAGISAIDSKLVDNGITWLCIYYNNTGYITSRGFSLRRFDMADINYTFKNNIITGYCQQALDYRITAQSSIASVLYGNHQDNYHNGELFGGYGQTPGNGVFGAGALYQMTPSKADSVDYTHYYIVSSGGRSGINWSISTTYYNGRVVKSNNAFWKMISSSAGVSGSSSASSGHAPDPAGLNIGDTITDNEITWQLIATTEAVIRYVGAFGTVV